VLHSDLNYQRSRRIKDRRTGLGTSTTTIMRAQTGIMKGFIDTPDTGIITAGGTTITAINHSPTEGIAITRIKRIGTTHMKSMAITLVSDPGINLVYTADTHTFLTNTTLKAIPTEIISN
jgi:hypothetical protein